MRGWMMCGGVVVVGLSLACGGQIAALGGLGDGEPLYGTLALGAEDIEVGVRAGGSTEASSVTGVPPSCVGYIAPEQPDVVLQVPSTQSTLKIGSCSQADTALLVRTPMGTIECVDDTEQINPVWSGSNAAAGDYEIWVATYGQGGSSSADLRITTDNGPVCTEFDATGPAQMTLDPLTSGFGTSEASVTAGGGTPGGALSGQGTCTGWIPGEGPTARLSLSGGGNALNVAACSPSTDLTLIIQTPDGRLLCDDDTEDNQPVVRIPAAGAGDYGIFVGTYSEGERPSAMLKLSEAPGSLCSAPFVK